MINYQNCCPIKYPSIDLSMNQVIVLATELNTKNIFNMLSFVFQFE